MQHFDSREGEGGRGGEGEGGDSCLVAPLRPVLPCSSLHGVGAPPRPPPSPLSTPILGKARPSNERQRGGRRRPTAGGGDDAQTCRSHDDGGPASAGAGLVSYPGPRAPGRPGRARAAAAPAARGERGVGQRRRLGRLAAAAQAGGRRGAAAGVGSRRRRRRRRRGSAGDGVPPGTWRERGREGGREGSKGCVDRRAPPSDRDRARGIPLCLRALCGSERDRARARSGGLSGGISDLQQQEADSASPNALRLR